MVPEKVFYSQAASPSFSFSVLPAAHACSFAEPRSEETIQDIQITGNRPFRGRASGDTLSTFFDGVVLSEGGSGRFELDSFLARKPRAVTEELILLLDARPDTTARFQFAVEYEQEGPGLSRHEVSSAPVVLTDSSASARQRKREFR